MTWRTGGGLLVVVVTFAAIYGIGNSLGSSDPCADAPVLAAGSAVTFADSCVDMIEYRGTTYYVDCVRMHPSRLGRHFLDDGGDTYFEGARDIEGIPRDDAFILDGDYCRNKRVIAASDSFTRLQAGLLRVPVDAPDALELARQRQPWMVPGRRDIPDVLDIEAVLDGEVITITNRNHFEWRACDQFQVNAPDDEWAPWEARPSENLPRGDSSQYRVEEFGRDSSGLEQLTEDGARDLRGSEVFIFCRAPGGPASGSTRLR